MVKSICIFCGSASGKHPVYSAAASSVGKLLAERGIEIVYGGGSIGLMGVLADQVLEVGGKITGVIPRALFDKELGHSGLHKLHVVESMHERKAMMASLSDAFLALPGGFGTFEEFFEIITWSQLGIHKKPFGLLNTAGYYDPLLRMCDQAVAEGFIDPQDRARIVSHGEPEVLVRNLLSTQVPPTTRWLRESES